MCSRAQPRMTQPLFHNKIVLSKDKSCVQIIARGSVTFFIPRAHCTTTHKLTHSLRIVGVTLVAQTATMALLNVRPSRRKSLLWYKEFQSYCATRIWAPCSGLCYKNDTNQSERACQGHMHTVTSTRSLKG